MADRDLIPKNQKHSNISVPDGKTYLLTIGINDYFYLQPKLDNAVKDIQDFVELMINRYGFDQQYIRVLKDEEATYENIDNELRFLIKNVTPQDNVLIYFSGHGLLDEEIDEGFWLPVDAKLAKVNSYFSNSAIKKILDKINSFHTFVIVDSCFAGALFLEEKYRSITDGYNFPSRWGLTSGRKTIVSDGKIGENSPFAKALLNTLQQFEEYLNVGKLCDVVKQSVVAATDRNQIPIGQYLNVHGHQGGEYVFQPLNNAELVWKDAYLAKDPFKLQSFLNKYPTNVHKDEALLQIKELLVKSSNHTKQEIERSNHQREKDFWETVRIHDTLFYYHDYMTEFPQGHYLVDARKRIEELQKKSNSTNLISSPPPPTLNIPDSLILVKGGTFEMGDVLGDNENKDESVHFVTLNNYYIAKYQLTFDEFDAFCKASNRGLPKDGGWGRGKRPVINVNWFDAVAYCNWRSIVEGLKEVYQITGTMVEFKPDTIGYRLPTEAEWEYAARGGGQKIRFGNGKDVANSQEINFDGSEKYKKIYSISGEYRAKTVSVGSLNSPNILGIHDMSGNVLEWCWDGYDANYYKNTPIENPRGSNLTKLRVLRGGSWMDIPNYSRTSSRNKNSPDFHNFNIGFRLVLGQ